MKRAVGKTALRATLAAIFASAATFASTAQAQLLQFATAFPESDFSSQVVKRWTDGVTEATNGRIKFNIHWSGSLVGNKMVDAMSDGVVDAALSFTPYVSGEIIDLAPLDVPFSFPLDAEGLKAFSGEVLPVVDAIYEKRGSRAVAAPPVILPDPVTCKDRFVSSEASWKGVKIRTAGRWQAETISRWGGSPVVLAPGDLYTALDLGTVNCTLMVLNAVVSLKLYEPAKYITRIDHSIAFGTINVSNDTWNRLSEEDRKMMLKVGQDTVEWGIAQYTQAYEKTLEDLGSLGAKFCVPPKEEFDRLIAAANDVFEKAIAPNTTADGKALIELINRYRDKVVAQPTVGDVTPCPAS